MKKILHLIRGAAGMAVTWMIGWIPIGVVFGLTMAVLTGFQFGLVASAFMGARLFGGLGLMAGGLFSLVVGLTEGQSRFDQLSIPRFASLGAVGGALLAGIALANGAGGPGLGLDHLVAVLAISTLSAGSAAATLLAARKGTERLSPGSEDEIEDAGLSADEKRRLLGA